MATAGKHYDVIVLGGGAAGLMCAATAGRRGRRVLILEGSNKVGKKILMSGGGRCNFTNLYCEPAHFISANPNFCISALSRYTQWDFIALVEQHGIAYHEKTLGQLFCDNSSRDILNLLETECAQAKVDILTECNISEVKRDEHFSVGNSGNTYTSDALVIATGGLSIPKMGASDIGYRLASQFGLKLRETRAGLVPFTFSGRMHGVTNRLSGVSLTATLSCPEAAFTEDILFTHRGLSGPAALQLSSYWQPGTIIEANLLPDQSAAARLLAAKQAQPRSTLRKILTQALPRALVAELQSLWWADLAERPMADFSDKKLRQLAGYLNAWPLKPAATEGYRTAEVTLGGIDTTELSSRTMECNSVPGLFCIGEVVDVTGHLGGFNFQWAWSSAQAAGQAV